MSKELAQENGSLSIAAVAGTVNMDPSVSQQGAGTVSMGFSMLEQGLHLYGREPAVNVRSREEDAEYVQSQMWRSCRQWNLEMCA
jgi:hypothetical protein